MITSIVDPKQWYPNYDLRMAISDLQRLVALEPRLRICYQPESQEEAADGQHSHPNSNDQSPRWRKAS